MADVAELATPTDSLLTLPLSWDSHGQPAHPLEQAGY